MRIDFTPTINKSYTLKIIISFLMKNLQIQQFSRVSLVPGDYVAVHVAEAGNAMLMATGVARTSLAQFLQKYGSTVPGKVEECEEALPRRVYG